jgi:hypothetical protein
MKANKATHWTKAVLLVAGLVALSTTGCQTHIGGQTLPSPYYLRDDVQYFAPGSENKLAAESAAMKALSADQNAQGN